MSSGGKRLRAVLAMIACETVGGSPRIAAHGAAAIEILHNFTLVHDDVMDSAPLRRNRMTVHQRWDTNTAILAGDEMIAIAYRVLLASGAPALPEILKTFTRAFIEVCEGQGLDKEFESRNDVTVREYCSMIGKKTARVIAASAEIGGLAGNATEKQRAALRSYGECLGMAFQMNDDLLDIVGDPRAFGKAIGGDIAEGKKTLLLLRAIERSKGSNREFLRSLRAGLKIRRSTITRVRRLYATTGSIDETRIGISRMTAKAQRALSSLPDNRGRAMLSWLADELLDRAH